MFKCLMRNSTVPDVVKKLLDKMELELELEQVILPSVEEEVNDVLMLLSDITLRP